jgi:hypothetical protein
VPLADRMMPAVLVSRATQSWSPYWLPRWSTPEGRRGGGEVNTERLMVKQQRDVEGGWGGVGRLMVKQQGDVEGGRGEVNAERLMVKQQGDGEGGDAVWWRGEEDGGVLLVIQVVEQQQAHAGYNSFRCPAPAAPVFPCGPPPPPPHTHTCVHAGRVHCQLVGLDAELLLVVVRQHRDVLPVRRHHHPCLAAARAVQHLHLVTRLCTGGQQAEV